MNIISYLGAEGDNMVVTQPTDVYVLLDWLHSRYIEKAEQTNNALNKRKWERAADYVATMMDIAHSDGFGSPDDVAKSYH